jgi:hypothetical protein
VPGLLRARTPPLLPKVRARARAWARAGALALALPLALAQARTRASMLVPVLMPALVLVLRVQLQPLARPRVRARTQAGLPLAPAQVHVPMHARIVAALVWRLSRALVRRAWLASQRQLSLVQLPPLARRRLAWLPVAEQPLSAALRVRVSAQ